MQLSSDAVSPLRRVYDSPDLVDSLSSAANFARFQLPDLLPQLHRALYLDVDTLVQGNVLEIWQHLLASSKMMVAVPRCSCMYCTLDCMAAVPRCSCVYCTLDCMAAVPRCSCVYCTLDCMAAVPRCSCVYCTLDCMAAVPRCSCMYCTLDCMAAVPRCSCMYCTLDCMAAVM